MAKATTQKTVYRNKFIPWSNCSEEQRELLRESWVHGDLSYKLSPAQLEVYEAARKWSESKNRQGRSFIFDIGRRFGKSSIMVTIGFEDCIRRPRSIVRYIGPRHKDLMDFIDEHLYKMLLDCPPELKPEWVKGKTRYEFANGSKLTFIGLDINPNAARGGAFDTALLDEAAFFDNLENIMESVLFPQMLGRPHARMYAGSTPPISPSHYWSQTVVPEAKLEGACITRTLDDSDIYSQEEKEEFIRKLGGRKSSKCRRELFAQHVTDESLAIIPEFREVEEHVMGLPETPYWRLCYTSMDPGWHDHTAVLFGYWHFEKSLLCIEDEFSAPRLHSGAVAEGIRIKETALWAKTAPWRRGSFESRPQPFMRVSDNDPRMISDLASDHGLLFIPTMKDNLDEQINAVRMAFSEHRIRIHPRCKMLRDQLLNGVWKNEARKVFAREGGDMGHFDLIAALVYLWRNANLHRHRNPAPIAQKYVAGDLPVRGDSNVQDKQGQSKWARRGGRLFLNVRSKR